MCGPQPPLWAEVLEPALGWVSERPHCHAYKHEKGIAADSRSWLRPQCPQGWPIAAPDLFVTPPQNWASLVLLLPNRPPCILCVDARRDRRRRGRREPQRLRGTGFRVHSGAVTGCPRANDHAGSPMKRCKVAAIGEIGIISGETTGLLAEGVNRRYAAVYNCAILARRSVNVACSGWTTYFDRGADCSRNELFNNSRVRGETGLTVGILVYAVWKRCFDLKSAAGGSASLDEVFSFLFSWAYRGDPLPKREALLLALKQSTLWDSDFALLRIRKRGRPTKSRHIAI